jgi:dolichol kinase
LISLNEVLRKLIHLGSTIIPISYLAFDIPRITMAFLLGLASLIVVYIDLGRTRIKWIEALFANVFNNLLRRHERKGMLTGASWVIIGAFVTILLFPRDFAVLALLFMFLGDTAAALVGLQFGKTHIWDKSLEGTIAGLIVCLAVGIAFPNIPLLVLVCGAITAMVIELLPIPIDDNLRIPVAAGAVMVLIDSFFI